jgi:hypothetical protein
MPAVILALIILSLTFPVTSFDDLVALSLIGGPLLVYLFAVQTRVISIVGLLAAGGYVLWARGVLTVSDGPGLGALVLPFVGWIGACCLVVIDLFFVLVHTSSGGRRQHRS